MGEHDTYSAARLEAELGVLLDEGRRIVIDLRDADFIDSTTLGTLLAARREADQAGLGFTIVLPQRRYTQVNKLLDLTGLASSFALYEKLDDALAAARDGKTKGSSVRSAA